MTKPRTSKQGPAKSTRIAGGRYYLVQALGKRRVWIPLTKVSDGLSAFYRALAQANEPVDSIAALVKEWEADIMPRHAAKTQRDEMARNKIIAARFEEFAVAQVTPPDVVEFLKCYRDKPRTFNAFRSQIAELMRFAIERGLREPGSNPVSSVVKTMKTRARDRYITDSELRRIKVAAMRSTDRHGNAADTRSGPMLCAVIDMAYLTGQAIGDLLDLRWEASKGDPMAPHIRADGIWFARKKVSKSTREEVLIRWTPKLRDVARRLTELRATRKGDSPWVFTAQDGDRYSYWGLSSAWQRARKRSGVTGCTLHDIRAKAITDKESREGMREARTMGAHSTETQTADYVRNKTTRSTKATR